MTSTSSSDSDPISVRLLTVGLLFQGVSGLFGGAALVWDPTGGVLQLPLDLLAGSPFDTYLIPGLILFVVLGMGPLVVAAGWWRRRPWSWYGAVGTGAALVIWIMVEIAMVGYHPSPPLQLTYGLLGIGLLVIASLPSVRHSLLAESQ